MTRKKALIEFKKGDLIDLGEGRGVCTFEQLRPGSDFMLEGREVIVYAHQPGGSTKNYIGLPEDELPCPSDLEEEPYRARHLRTDIEVMRHALRHMKSGSYDLALVCAETILNRAYRQACITRIVETMEAVVEDDEIEMEFMKQEGWRLRLAPGAPVA